jgi:hypothetical protein
VLRAASDREARIAQREQVIDMMGKARRDGNGCLGRVSMSDNGIDNINSSSSWDGESPQEPLPDRA